MAKHYYLCEDSVIYVVTPIEDLERQFTSTLVETVYEKGYYKISMGTYVIDYDYVDILHMGHRLRNKLKEAHLKNILKEFVDG